MRTLMTRALVATGVLLAVLAPTTAFAEDNSGFLSLPPEGPYIAAVRLDQTAVVAAAATPPPSTEDIVVGDQSYVNGRCVGWEGLLARYSPGWSIERMSRIMYRESRCQPGAYNRRGRAHGLLQITPITFPYLTGALGESITSSKLFNPVFNVRAAAELFRERGYQPWSL